MSKLVQRIVALVVMLAVVMSATAYGASTFVVDYQELKSDAGRYDGQRRGNPRR